MEPAAQSPFTPYHPPGNDATVINKACYRVLGQTSYARIVDVCLPPSVQDSAVTPWTHGLRGLLFIDKPTKIEMIQVDGTQRQKSISSSTPGEHEIQSVNQEPLHFVRNLDPVHSFRATRIELRKASRGSPSPDLEENLTVSIKAKMIDSFHTDVVIRELEIAPGRSVQIVTNGRAGILLTVVQNTIKVWKRLQPTEMEIVKPYDKPEGEAAERPKVWPLNKRCTYEVLNESNTAQKVYCFEIKA